MIEAAADGEKVYNTRGETTILTIGTVAPKGIDLAVLACAEL